MSYIETGRNGVGMRWARLGGWRVLAYAGGGYTLQRRASFGSWRLPGPGEAPPEGVLPALMRALRTEPGEGVEL